MDASVQELLELEWRLFDEAPLAGQRSARPEDRELFTATRSGQLLTWMPELRDSWRKDLQTAQESGRNLVNEKYIYMLKQTNPQQYEDLKRTLPAACPEKLFLVDWICHAEVVWQEAIVKKYPRLTQNSRAIHSGLDCQGEISFETFLRGELMTCSVDTLRLYARQVECALKAGENLCERTLEHTVQQLGLKSIDEVEANL